MGWAVATVAGWAATWYVGRAVGWAAIEAARAAMTRSNSNHEVSSGSFAPAEPATDETWAGAGAWRATAPVTLVGTRTAPKIRTVPVTGFLDPVVARSAIWLGVWLVVVLAVSFMVGPRSVGDTTHFSANV